MTIEETKEEPDNSAGVLTRSGNETTHNSPNSSDTTRTKFSHLDVARTEHCHYPLRPWDF